MSQALSEFAQRTGMQLIYVSKIAGGKRSHAIPAGLPPAEALAKLLEGTGLAFAYLNARTVKIYPGPEAAPQSRPLTASTAPRDDQPLPVPETLDEVMVTATKREQRANTIPMSIRVLTAAEMYAAGIEDISGIAEVTPGIEYDFSSQFGPGILTNISIRGISADKGQPTTGIYIDDTPIQMPHTTFGDPFPVTFDLARVEVLRGPQGTLFGSSAEGGAIRYVPNAPSTTDSDSLYRAQISTTEQGGMSYEAGAAVGGPLISNTLGARLSAWYRDDGGYVNRVDPFTNAVVDPNANRSWSEAVRGALAIAPTDTLLITPSLSYQAAHVHDSPVFYTYLSDPSGGEFNSGRLLRQPDDDSFTLGSLKIEQHLGGNLLTAISSYFNRSAKAIVDTTNEDGVTTFGGYGNPLGEEYPTSYADAVPSDIGVHQILQSQEVRLTSPDPMATLSWVGGLFYSRLRLDETQYEYLVSAPLPPASTSNDYSVDTEVSGFGQATWRLSPQWSASAGLRLGWARGVNWGTSGGFLNGATPTSHVASDANLPPTPRFDLTYQPVEGQLYYITAAKGFRRGGTNGNNPPSCGAVTDPDTYAPDQVWSYEVGAKDQFFNRRLEFSTSVYDIHWTGIQEGVNDTCGNSYTANAGSARSQGFDLQAEAQLMQHLSLAMALGYIDVQYTRTLIAPGENLIADRGAVVGGVPSVPAPWSGTISLRYEWPLNSRAAGYTRIDDTIHSHNPGPFTELDQRYFYYDPRYAADPAQNLLNPQLGVKLSALDLKLFVTNALNQHPDLQKYADAPFSSLVYAYTLLPRTLGLNATWKY